MESNGLREPARGPFCVHFTDSRNRRIVLRDGAYGTFVMELHLPLLHRPARAALSRRAMLVLAGLLDTQGTAGRLPTSGDLPPVRVVHGHDGMKHRIDYVRISVARRTPTSSDLTTYRVLIPLDIAVEMASRIRAAVC